MKNAFFFSCIFLLISNTIIAQVYVPRINNKERYKEKIEGTKYVSETFSEATISSSSKIYLVRYDAYNEMFEFVDPNMTKRDTFLVNKTEQNKVINLLSSKKKYSLENFMNKDWSVHSTYFIEVKATESIILYKREKVNFTPEKPAENSMKRGFPAKYTRAEDSYFIKKAGDEYLLQFPESKKELIKMFPDKKEKIETYFKNNKNSFKTEADYISIIDLLTS